MADITSIKEYVEIVSASYERAERTLGREEILLFRGTNNSKYPLIPSIARYPEEHIHNSLLWYEQSMIQEAKRKRPDIFKEEEYPINLLTKLQHYGIPTRLLDITTNALVALFFACQKENEENGEIVVFKVDKDTIHSNTSAIANAIALSHTQGRLYDFNNLIGKAEKRIFFEGFTHDSVKHRYKKREDYLEKLKTDYFTEPLVIFPLELSERQKRQQGAFFIFPNKYKDEIEPIYKDNVIVEKLIHVPSSFKRKILDQLQIYGITKEFLFPDSIDSLSDTIKSNVFQLYKNSILNLEG